jgi:hypothetical protein
MNMTPTGEMDTGAFCTGGTVMQRGFQTTMESGTCIVYLFEGVVVDTEGKYAGYVILTFLLGFVIEALRFLRSRGLQNAYPMAAMSGMNPFLKDVILTCMYGAQMVFACEFLFNIQNLWSSSFVYCSYLRQRSLLLFCSSDWLMLIVMTYETVFFIAIIVGLAAGHLTFHQMKAHLAKSEGKDGKLTSYSAENVSGTPCCEDGI